MLGVMRESIRQTIVPSQAFVIGLTALFVLCQAGGFMCPPPDLAVPSVVAVAPDDPMMCPMSSGSACQPHLTSSQFRIDQIGKALQVLDQATVDPIDTPLSSNGFAPSRVASTSSPPLLYNVSLQVLRI